VASTARVSTKAKPEVRIELLCAGPLCANADATPRTIVSHAQRNCRIATPEKEFDCGRYSERLKAPIGSRSRKRKSRSDPTVFEFSI
jgi:hypothetical protein